MGRAFEYRKARKLKRWGNMSRTFTKIGKEITIAVKAAGPDPAGNSRLRVLLQNAKAANMPKDTVERAIKKATDKDASDYKEIVYEDTVLSVSLLWWKRLPTTIPVRLPTCAATSISSVVRSARRAAFRSFSTTSVCLRLRRKKALTWRSLNWNLSTSVLTRLRTRATTLLSTALLTRLPISRNILRRMASNPERGV